MTLRKRPRDKGEATSDQAEPMSGKEITRFVDALKRLRGDTKPVSGAARKPDDAAWNQFWSDHAAKIAAQDPTRGKLW